MANTLKLRFSSIKDFFSSKSDYLSYEMEAPYTDTYKVSFKKLKSVVIYNEKGIQILIVINKEKNIGEITFKDIENNFLRTLKKADILVN